MLDERLSQQPANDEPTAPDNRVQSRIIASKAYKKSKLSASPEEPETALRFPELSAPDGAVHVQDVSDERRGGVIPASQNASSSSKLPDEIAIEESSPPSPRHLPITGTMRKKRLSSGTLGMTLDLRANHLRNRRQNQHLMQHRAVSLGPIRKAIRQLRPVLQMK